jgi:hypothetical protein
MGITVATTRTGTGSISWVNQEQLDARLLCCVGDVLAQLRECPIAVPTALPSLNRYSPPDVGQIFKRECLASFRGLGNQGFRDAMVHIALEAVFLLRQLLQSALGVLCAMFLQAATMLVIAFSHLFNLFAAKDFAVAIRGKVDNAKVNAKHTKRFIRIGCFFGLGDVEIPHVATSYQFSTANLPGEVIQGAPLEVAQVKLTDDATADGIERHLITLHQAVGTRVVADAAVCGKGWARSVVMLAGSTNCFGGFVSGTTRKLCAKAKLGAGCAVDVVMQRVFIRDAFLPCYLSAVGCSSIERGLCLVQRAISRVANAQLTAYGTYGEGITHKNSIAQVYYLYKQGVAVFLRHLKEAVSDRIFL